MHGTIALVRLALATTVLAACGYPRPPDVPGPGDLPVVGFEFGASAVDELGGPPIQIPVVMSKPSNGFVSVSYTALPGGSAQEALDFRFPNLSGEVSLPPGATAVPIPIEIINDAMPEGEESVDIVIQVIGGFVELDETRDLHTLSIRAND